MLKTIKGKIIAGTATLVLVTGAGAAFANSDAGVKLGNWYNGQFTSTSTEIATTTGTYSAGLVNNYYNGEYKTLKSNSTTQINNTKTASTTASSGSINSAKEEHITAVNTKKDALLNAMEAQFNTISNKANFAINTAGAIGLTQAKADLTKHTGDLGTAALTSVTQDLGTASTNAKNELQAAIAQAKSDLEAKLLTEKDATVAEIKTMMDNKLTEISALINTKQQELVAAQQALITAKAAELELAAKGELQSLVDGI